MEKERLFELCKRTSLDNAIGMIVSNKINIGGDITGLTVNDAVQAVNDVLEYIKKSKRNPLPDGSLPLMESELEKPCEWQLDKDDIEGDSWYTSCGQRDISFCTGDAKENKYKFCPYCGRPIKEI